MSQLLKSKTLGFVEAGGRRSSMSSAAPQVRRSASTGGATADGMMAVRRRTKSIAPANGVLAPVPSPFCDPGLRSRPNDGATFADGAVGLAKFIAARDAIKAEQEQFAAAMAAARAASQASGSGPARLGQYISNTAPPASPSFRSRPRSAASRSGAATAGKQPPFGANASKVKDEMQRQGVIACEAIRRAVLVQEEAAMRDADILCHVEAHRNVCMDIAAQRMAASVPPPSQRAAQAPSLIGSRSVGHGRSALRSGTLRR